jgi:hypothetical protein
MLDGTGADRNVYHAAIDRIVRTVDVPTGAGIHVMRLNVGSCGLDEVIEGASEAVRALGFVPVRLGAPLLAAGEEVLHRHVVLFGDESDAEQAVPWVRQLTAASPRRHVLVLLSRRTP